MVVRAPLDPLQQDDIDRARRTPMDERVRQMIETVNFGFRMQEAAIRARFPGATEAEIDRRMRLWLAYDERWHRRDG
jgi:hypothetical protein